MVSLLAILGGLHYFGMIGVIVGPALASVANRVF